MHLILFLPRLRHRLALAAVLLLAAPWASRAATVWNGPVTTFTKADGADPTLPANQDRITPNVWITRGNVQGIYNIKTEASFTHFLSPADTAWANGTLANYASLTYNDWNTWAKNVNGGPDSTVGLDAVVHLISEDIYIGIKFTAWTSGGLGGFAYQRTTAGPLPPVLAIDFNDRSNDPVANSQSGFSSFLIASNGAFGTAQTGNVVRTFGAYTVTVSGSGANPGYDDRLRGTPVNGGALTQGQLYRDFIFSPDTGSGGLNVTVAGLTPNQAYRVTGWSFDQGTTGGRLSDWSANGFLLVDNYFFNGSTLPTTDTQYQWTFKVSASPSGQIALTGRRDSASPAGVAVFLNALQLDLTTPDAPTIVAGPAPVEVYAGDNPAFTATIGGTAPFTYQWRKDGSPIVGATNLAFSITNAQAADAAGYSLVASNSSGTATSAPAALTIRAVTNITAGLIAYWPLDTLTDGTPDLSGYQQTLWATNLDNGNLVPGQRGNALYFNGNDEFLTRTNAATNALAAYAYPAYTVAMWVRGYYTNQTDRRVWAESANTNNSALMTIGTDTTGTNGNVDIFIRNNNGTTPHNHKKSTVTNAFNGAWHHLAWVDNNGSARLYVDGVLDATDFSYVRGVLTPNIASLGVVYRTNNIAHFNGSLDDAAVWRRALSQSEVQYVMTNGPVLPDQRPRITKLERVTLPVVGLADAITFTTASGFNYAVFLTDDLTVPLVDSGELHTVGDGSPKTAYVPVGLGVTQRFFQVRTVP